VNDDPRGIRNWILGVLGTVVATLLVAGLNYLIPSVWEFTKSSASWIYGVLTYQVQLPVWSLGIIGALLVPTLHIVWRSFRRPEWHDYTDDMFEGVRWRWKYEGHQIVELWCYCPNDDTKLTYSEEGGAHQGWLVHFECDTCHRLVGPLNRRMREIIAGVERQIDRKIRTGDWQPTNIEQKNK
jgi:hypothetical protein